MLVYLQDMMMLMVGGVIFSLIALRVNNRMWISLIRSDQSGNLSKLIREIKPFAVNSRRLWQVDLKAVGELRPVRNFESHYPISYSFKRLFFVVGSMETREVRPTTFGERAEGSVGHETIREMGETSQVVFDGWDSDRLSKVKYLVRVTDSGRLWPLPVLVIIRIPKTHKFVEMLRRSGCVLDRSIENI